MKNFVRGAKKKLRRDDQGDREAKKVTQRARYKRFAQGKKGTSKKKSNQKCRWPHRGKRGVKETSRGNKSRRSGLCEKTERKRKGCTYKPG